VTPAVQKFLKGVLADIEKTIPHISSAHESDQGKLDALYKKLKDAIAALEEKKAEHEKTKAAIGATFGKLSACRKEESDIYGKWQVCLSEQKALQEIKDSKSAAMASVLRDFVSLFGGSPSEEEMLKPAFRARVSSTIDSFKVANKELNVAIKNLDEKTLECEGIAKSLSEKKAACDAIQGTFESDFCAYASDIKSTCSNFDKTYKLLSGLFADEKASVKKLEEDRKVEFTGLKQAACVLKAIMGSSGEISFGDIETCKKSTTSTDHLDIKYDDTPAKPACTPLPPYPCAGAFVAKYYSKMPTGTAAATCTPCSGPPPPPTPPPTPPPAKVTYSQNFVQGQRTPAQCRAFRTFRTSTSGGGSVIEALTGSTVRYKCSDSGVANQIITALSSGKKMSVKCGGVSWSVGTCGSLDSKTGWELLVGKDSTICRCHSSGANFVLRPCIGNSNWGGYVKTCSASSQNLGLKVY
jgi:hypothetical protein